jgi:hypothetical protein
MKPFPKYSLVILIALVLFIPMAQMKLELFDKQTLEGGITIAEKPEFKKDTYWDLSWQEDFGKYVNDNFGFRTWCVKLINQIRYSFFNHTKAPGVVVGKKGELFIESYIDDYIGRNYIGQSKINENVTKIKRLQDSLSARGKDLIVVFAPGKASYYPELLPDNYLRKQKDSTNYRVYAQAFAGKQVNFIDLNKWFFNNKANFKYKIYPKYGTHWNHYGMTVALDTIIKYIEHKRHINIPDLSYNIVNYSTKLKGNDFDIGILMNLLSPIKKDINPYPIYKITDKKENTSYTKPDVLVVGDSYWWCVVGDDLPKKFFREDEYWFYNRDIVFQNNQQKDKVKEVNLSSSLAQRDVVLLMATEATFYMFPYGFVDNAYKLYCEDNSKRLNDIKHDIQQNAEWYAKVTAKAAENNITLDKQMQLDAEYILSDELFKPKPTLESIMENIRNTPEWMKDVEAKAKENNIAVEEQLKKDAQWQLDNSGGNAKAAEDKPEETLESIIAYIKSDAKWMADIKAKAKENNISEEEQLKKDAQWQLDNKKGEHASTAPAGPATKAEEAKPNAALESIISYIKSDAKWMADIKAKAKENKISEEEQIKKDAQWQLEQKKK